MKMKVITLLLIIMLALPLAVAEDVNDDLNIGTNEGDDASDIEIEEVADAAIDLVTEEEIIIMEDNFGAKVRIMQLQLAALRSYLVGEEVIVILAEDENISDLSAIQAEIEILKDEIFEMDGTSETAVEDFVAIKRDLKTSVKEFKKLVAGKLTQEKRTQVMTAINGNEELALLKIQIRNTIRAHNKNRIGKMLDRMQAKKEDILAKIEAGELTIEQVKNRVMEEYQKLSKAKQTAVKKATIAKKLAQEKTKEAKRDEIVQNYVEVQKKRIQERLDQMPPELKEKIKANKDQLIQKLNKVKEALINNNKTLNDIRNRVKNAGGVQ